MRSIANLALITFFGLGVYFSTGHILNPAAHEISPSNIPQTNAKSNMNLSISSARYDMSSVTTGWQVILDERFSGAWPWSGWRVVDLYADTKTIYWGTDQYRYHSGNMAA